MRGFKYRYDMISLSFKKLFCIYFGEKIWCWRWYDQKYW